MAKYRITQIEDYEQFIGSHLFGAFDKNF